MIRRRLFLACLMLSGCGASAPSEELLEDGESDDFLVSGVGKSDQGPIAEGSASALGILDIVNEQDREVLASAAGLGPKTVEAIVRYGQGRDAIEGTGDDRLIESLRELDGVGHTGTIAFSKLAGLAKDTPFVQKRRRACGVSRAIPADLPHGRSKGLRAEADEIVIPVYVHVVRSGRGGRIPDAVIAKQIEVLNQAYRGQFGGAESSFRFELREVTRVHNRAWYKLAAGTETDFAMRAALRKGGRDALNLYFVRLQNDLDGWAEYPWDFDKAPTHDGVVLDNQALPGSRFAASSVGHSATHEVGHWLGLYHPFETGCDVGSGSGDSVADTPAQLDEYYECEPRDSCPDLPGEDPIHNYMSYTGDLCTNEFTAGQIERMTEMFALHRLAMP